MLPKILLGAGIVAAVALIAWGADRLLLRMERAGWIFYRKRKPSPGSVGNALMEVQSLLQPSVREAIEARKDHEAQDEDGAPPDPGKGGPAA